MLGDFCERDKVQLALFAERSEQDNRDNLLVAIDKINQGGMEGCGLEGNAPRRTGL